MHYDYAHGYACLKAASKPLYLIIDTPTHELFLYKLVTNMGKQNLPPVKVAILIDGGFFIKRFNALYNQDKTMTGEIGRAHV